MAQSIVTVGGKAGIGAGYFGEIWRYRELFYFLVWRDVKVRYKQSVLGALWAIIQPFFMMVVFTVFFGKFGDMPSDGIPYPIFYYSALLPWTYFSGAVATAGISLETNRDLITKVYFPRTVIPAASALRGLLDFAIASLVLWAMMPYYHYVPDLGVLLWPLLLVPLIMFTLGISMVFAALNVKYRDIKHALPFVVQLGLFLTPIIYPMSQIPERYHLLVALYPMCGLIHAFRASLIPGQPVEPALLAVSTSVAVLVFVVGLIYFHRTERTFADVV